MASNERDPVPDTASPRRMMVRRARGGGFGGGSSTVSESLRTGTNEEADEVDDLIDVDDPAYTAEAIQRRILAEGTRQGAGQGHDDGDDGNDGGSDSGIPDPRQRMNEVAMAGSQSYSREYRLTLIHRLLMRRVPLDQIAKQLKVSVSTIEKDRVLLKQHLRELSRSMNADEMIGAQNELYNEISGMALQMATLKDTPSAMKLAAMRTVLAANADRTRFLNTAGVYDVLRYRRAEDGSDVSDVQMLMNKTNEMMERMMAGGVDLPAAPQRKRIVRAGSFSPMTMDDTDASGSSAETVDL